MKEDFNALLLIFLGYYLLLVPSSHLCLRVSRESEWKKSQRQFCVKSWVVHLGLSLSWKYFQKFILWSFSPTLISSSFPFDWSVLNSYNKQLSISNLISAFFPSLALSIKKKLSFLRQTTIITIVQSLLCKRCLNWDVSPPSSIFSPSILFAPKINDSKYCQMSH
jgi:hypothetical protein